MLRAWRLCLPVLLGLAGCAHEQTARLQSEDVDRSKITEISTIGDVTAFSNVEPVAVSGIGLVYGLEGTGHSPPGYFRDELERDMKKNGIREARRVLENPDFAMVMVSALIPAGVEKGDPIDVQISLPEGSKTTSLRGGKLAECHLVPYQRASSVSSRVAQGGGDRLLLGNSLVRAEGDLITDIRKNRPEAGDDDPWADNPKIAMIWNGGRLREPRPLYLSLHREHQRARLAMQIAQQINARFQTRGGEKVAEAKTKEAIVLRVPAQYRLNLSRFLRVARMVPQEPLPSNSPYRYALEKELLDPATALTAALRLEAIGSDARGVLRIGLDHSDQIVRFACAESLAYLGDAGAARELAHLAVERPETQMYCLTALASLNEPVSIDYLQEMLRAESPALRYSAFRALRELDPRLTLIQGESLKGEFWLHQIAPGSDAMVHVRTDRRAEVAVFGNTARLTAPFALLIDPDFTLKAGSDDETCSITCFSKVKGVSRKECSFALDDIVRTMTEMGAEYVDVVSMLRQANRASVLNCPLVEDARPEGVDVYELAQLGAEGLGGTNVLTPSSSSDVEAIVSGTRGLFD